MSYLIDYAVNNFWCDPLQDQDIIIKLARISDPSGSVAFTRVVNERIELPDNLNTYHIFQVGNYSPKIYNILSPTAEWQILDWTDLVDMINNSTTWIDVYNSSGIQIPKMNVYYKYTNNTRDFIIAIRQETSIPFDYINDDFFIRIMYNQWFTTVDKNIYKPFIASAKMTSTSDILAIQTTYNTYNAKSGYTYCYINGRIVDSITLVNTSVGDYVDVIYDPTVIRAIDIPVKDLLVFTSSLDSKRKYLIHDKDNTDKSINYQDNIDIYLTNPTNTKFNGLYFHRNQADSHRMVTNRDYSIPVDYLVSLYNAYSNTYGVTNKTMNDFNIRVIIKRSGFNHKLVFEDMRISELTKLDDSNLTSSPYIGAMLGSVAQLPIWKADALESSFYTSVMNTSYENLSDEKIQKALGYNALSKLTADIPSYPRLTGLNTYIATVPHELTDYFTGYEYDSNGYLLGFYTGTNSTEYNVQNINCAKVEVISGIATTTPDIVETINSATITSDSLFRVYCTGLNTDGEPIGDWTDITNTDRISVVQNSNGTQTITYVDTNAPNQYIVVRTDRTFVTQTINQVFGTGVINLTFKEKTLSVNEKSEGIITPTEKTMRFPLGDLTVFLNKRSLVEGIDYFVNFPEITIVNKAYLIQPVETANQVVDIRWSGFCYSDMSYRKAIDKGFIVNDALMNRNQYDDLDDSVIRIVANGAFKTRDELGISTTTVGTAVNQGFSGKPYEIRKPMIPLRGLIDNDFMDFMLAAEDKDTKVENYMELYLPKVTKTIVPIQNRYKVYSPFISNLIWALQNDYITEHDIGTNVQSIQVFAICKPYEYLLKLDPIYDGNQLDSRFVVVEPLATTSLVTLSKTKYKFLFNAVKLYCNGLIDISAFVTIQS